MNKITLDGLENCRQQSQQNNQSANVPAKSEQQDKLQQRSCSQRRAACFSAGEREPSVTPSSPFSWSGNIKIMRGCCSAAWGEGGVLEGLEGTFLWVTAGRGVSTGSSMGRADVGYCFQEWVLCVGPMKLWGWDGVRDELNTPPTPHPESCCCWSSFQYSVPPQSIGTAEQDNHEESGSEPNLLTSKDKILYSDSIPAPTPKSMTIWKQNSEPEKWEIY